MGRPTIALVATVLAGCPGGGGATEDGCAASLSGGLTGEYECDSVSLLYNEGEDAWAFALGGGDDDVTLTVLGSADGEPATGTFECAGTLGAEGSGWVAGVASCVLTFDAVSSISSAGGLGAYEADGSIEVTFEDELTDRPSVAASIDFSAR